MYSEDLRRWIEVGASPRASLSLDKCARTHAWLYGRTHVIPDDVRAIAHDVMRHRVMLSYEGVGEGKDADAVIDQILELVALPSEGLIVTAPGDACDFVSRYFVPQAGIPEDPVTGSAHCVLAPYWARRLDKQKLSARQVSARGGELTVEDRGERVLVAGRVAPYLEGRIRV